LVVELDDKVPQTIAVADGISANARKKSIRAQCKIKYDLKTTQ